MKLVSPAALTGAEKLVFDNLKPWLPSQGVCVNVMLGQDPWDIRPLMLMNGKVYLYRFSRPLGQKALSALVAEMQGFSVIPGWDMSVEARNEAERLLLIRPVYQSTLEDRLSTGDGVSGPERQEIIAGLIDVVKSLRKRSLVHGHISPSNIVEVDGSIVLIDPRLGALHCSRDRFLAPEITGSSDPSPEVDLFGVGSVLSRILGDEITHQQKEIIDRLLLPAPRQRPSLEEVEREFVRSLPPQERGGARAGKVLRKTRESASPAPEVAKDARETMAPSRGGFSWLVGVAVVVALGAVALKVRYPWVYNDIIRRVDLLSPASDPELQLAWASNDKGRMRVVAEAAIRDHSRAAENAIIDDTLAGENRPGVAANLLRVAFSDLWVNDLSIDDKRAAVVLSVTALYPDGVKTLPALSSLHPGVILAVTGQSQAKNPSKQLSEISLDRLVSLPSPIGPLFAQLAAGGSSTLGDPEVIALAGIVSGNPPAETLEAYIGADTPLPVALARISIVLPLLAANEGTASQLLATLRDRGGEIGQTLSWFDIDGLGIWTGVKSSEKLRLILGDLPDRDLKVEQLADLLTFPIAEVRNRSAQALRAKFLKGESDPLMLVLGGDQNRLSRDQTVALVSALGLDISKRAPYVSVFFQLNPSPDMVLLVLMARADKDSSDLFNLEAARYLRKNSQFNTTTEMLQILSHHPEPLARSIAYARLTARDPAHKKILQQRVSEEGDPGLLKSITAKLAPPVAPASVAPQTAGVGQKP